MLKASLRHLLQPVAVKEFGCREPSSFQARSKEQLLKEAHIFHKLGPSRSVPRVYGLINKVGCYQLVLELCSCNWWELNERGLIEVYGGQAPSSLAEVDAGFLKTQVLCAQDAAAALHLLHCRGLIHCDVKPANFLVGRELVTPPGWESHFEESWQDLSEVSQAEHRTVLKVTDFARAQQQQQSSNRYPWQDGSLVTDAPEVYKPVIHYLLTGEYVESYLTEKSDVFALGLTIAMIVTFQSSFYLPQMTPGQQAQARSEGRCLPKNPGCVPSCLWEVLEECFEGDPEKRPSMGELLLMLTEVVDEAVEEVEAAKGRGVGSGTATPVADDSADTGEPGSQSSTLLQPFATSTACQQQQQPAAVHVVEDAEQHTWTAAVLSRASPGQQRIQQAADEDNGHEDDRDIIDQQDAAAGPGDELTAAGASSSAAAALGPVDGLLPQAANSNSSIVHSQLTLAAAVPTVDAQGGSNPPVAPVTAEAGAAAEGQPLHQLAMADVDSWRSTRSREQQQRQHPVRGKAGAAAAAGASTSSMWTRSQTAAVAAAAAAVDTKTAAGRRAGKAKALPVVNAQAATAVNPRVGV